MGWSITQPPKNRHPATIKDITIFAADKQPNPHTLKAYNFLHKKNEASNHESKFQKHLDVPGSAGKWLGPMGYNKWGPVPYFWV